MKKLKILILIILLFIIIASLGIFPEIISSCIIICIACLFFIYWIRIIFKYERDSTYKQEIACNEDELLAKYTPIEAGCIQENRNALFRDVVATLLDLVDKKYLLLEISKSFDGNYMYFVKTNRESNYTLNEVEAYILKWFSKKDNKKLEWLPEATTKYSVSEFKAINLLERLKEMTKEKRLFDKMERIDEKVMKKINKAGFNKNLIPTEVKNNNYILLVFSILVFLISVFHILTVGVNLLAFGLVVNLPFVLVIIMPIIYFIIYKFLLNPLSKTRNNLLKRIIKNNFSFRSVSIISVLIIICCITFITTKSLILLANVLLFGISLLIVLTSNVSLKNDLTTMADYSALNTLKNKIENYSLFQDREIKEIILWGKYLVYSISFGISIESKKQFQDLDNMRIYKELLDDREMVKYFKFMR